jgi:hypothetical protein
MSIGRQFDQGATHQRVQSRGHQFNRLGVLQNFLWTFSVMGIVKVGGWKPLTKSRLDLGGLYQHGKWTQTGVAIIDDGMGGLTYPQRQQTIEVWWHPLIGDIYKVVLWDSLNGFYETWEILGNGSIAFYQKPPEEMVVFDLYNGSFLASNYTETLRDDYYEFNITTTLNPAFINNKLELSDLAQPPTRSQAIDMMNLLNIVGNNPFTMDDGHGIQHTGLDSIVKPTVFIEYARTSDGVRIKYGDHPYNTHGNSGLCGTNGAVNSVLTVVASPPRSLPTSSPQAVDNYLLESASFYYQASKCKIATTNDQIIEIRQQSRLFPEDTVINGFISYLQPNELENYYPVAVNTVVTLPPVNPTEPCAINPLATRCRYGKSYDPDDAPVWGTLSFHHPP